MISILAIPLFALAYTIKGGQFNNYLTALPKFVSPKLLACLIVFIFCSTSSGDWIHGLKMVAAWIFAVHVSMGEDVGAIGRLKLGWGKYLEWMPKVNDFELFGRKLFSYTEGRWFGLNKALQRGAWMGGVFALAGASEWSFLIMAIGFTLSHFAFQELYYRINKVDDWKYAEPAVGAFLGLCYAI